MAMTDAEKKLASDKKHKAMLKKLANVRVPRVTAAILSVGTLGVHKPTPAQATAIMRPLEEAVKIARERLAGAAQSKPSFVLPD